MRLVVSDGQRVRKAGDGETQDVVDTATLSHAERYALGLRLTTEQSGDLIGELFAEHPDLFDEGDDGDEDDGGGHQQAPQPAPPSWDQAGLVMVKTTYPDDSPYHGMPGLEAPAQSWLATVDADLAANGTPPGAAVTAVELWWPNGGGGATHYEVGAVIAGSYAKFDLTSTGYRLIFNATRPTVGGYYRGASTFNPSGLDLRTLYTTFLQVAADNGPFDMDTNDCERFATVLCGRLGGTWEGQEGDSL